MCHIKFDGHILLFFLFQIESVTKNNPFSFVPYTSLCRVGICRQA